MAKKHKSGQINITAAPTYEPPPKPKKAVVHGVLGVEDIHMANWRDAGPSRQRRLIGSSEPQPDADMSLRSRYLPRERMDRFYNHKYGSGEPNKTVHEEREERDGET
jgi:hypothetical protein